MEPRRKEEPQGKAKIPARIFQKTVRNFLKVYRFFKKDVRNFRIPAREKNKTGIKIELLPRQ
jgi:hypothetical protein